MAWYSEWLRKGKELLVEETSEGLILLQDGGRMQAAFRGLASRTQGRVLLPGGGIRGNARSGGGPMMWPITNGAYWPTAVGKFRVYSANAADDIGGTGAQKARVVYLDDSFAIQSEEVSLAGAGTGYVESSAADCFRVLDTLVTQKGAGGKNAGLITVRRVNGTDYLDCIEAGMNQAISGKFTVPAGQKFIAYGHSAANYGLALEYCWLSSTYNPSTGAVVAGVWNTMKDVRISGNHRFVRWGSEIVFPAGADLLLTHSIGVPNDATFVIHGRLVDET